MRCSLKS